MAKSARSGTIQVGTAGWSIPKGSAAQFPAAGTHLARYADRFSAVEINSSFYRPHRPATYTRWSRSVPDDFLFAVKVPKEATHSLRLVDAEAILDRFLSETESLGEKLGPLLVQLPPSLAFSQAVAKEFFVALRQRFDGGVALEPRHASWFEPAVDRLLTNFLVARVAADPAVVPGASIPGGWDGLRYFRLHGSPKKYYSAYTDDFLDALAERLSASAKSSAVWCILDNTAAGEAMADALRIIDRLGRAT